MLGDVYTFDISWSSFSRNATSDGLTFNGQSYNDDATIIILEFGGIPLTELGYQFTGFAGQITATDGPTMPSIANHLFYQATASVLNIGHWNMSPVTTLSNAFRLDLSFNTDIGSWNTSNVTDMKYMFTRATSFNQNLGQWDFTNVTDVTAMFKDSSLNYSTYSSFIQDLSSNDTIQSGTDFGQLNFYRIDNTSTNDAYSYLTTKGVTITDYGSLSLEDLQDLFGDILIGNICFRKGTPVNTDQGIIDIDKILPHIHTIRNKKIVHITKTVSVHNELVLIKKNALCNSVPHIDSVMSKEHSIFWNGVMQPVKNLVNNDTIIYIPNTGETLYNVLLNTHYTMIVNNMIVETLHPDNLISKIYKCMQSETISKKNELIKEFNVQIKKHNIYVQ